MPSVFRRPGRSVWEFKYKDADGKWKYGTGWPSKKKTLEHAQGLEADRRAVRKGEKEDPRLDLSKRNTPADVVLAEYVKWGQRQGGRYGKPWDGQNAKLKEASLKWWLTEMKLQRLCEIDIVVVETLVQDILDAGKAPKTAALKVEALRSLCRWAVMRRYLRHNPLDGMTKMDKTPKVPHRPLESKEVAALLNTAPEPRHTWYSCALDTGFRLNELRSLLVKHLDAFGPSLFLPAADSKDRKDHRQPISEDLLAQLQTLAEGKAPNEPLLGIPKPGAHKGHRYDPAGLFAADCRLAGVPLMTDAGKTTWHSMRKAFVTNVVRSGADLKTCMTLARHSTASLTMETYAADDPALVREAAMKAAEAVKEAVRVAACCADVAKQVAQGGGNPVSLDGESRLHEVKVVGDTGLEPAEAPTEQSTHSQDSIGTTTEPRRFGAVNKNASDDAACCAGVANIAPTNPADIEDA